MSKRFTEEVISIKVDSGTSVNNVTKKLKAGKIIGLRGFTNGAEAGVAGLVRAEITDSTGFAVCPLQPVSNFKPTSGGGYQESSKPLRIEGGQALTLSVIAQANFAADFYMDLVVVYEIEEIC